MQKTVPSAHWAWINMVHNGICCHSMRCHSAKLFMPFHTIVWNGMNSFSLWHSIERLFISWSLFIQFKWNYAMDEYYIYKQIYVGCNYPSMAELNSCLVEMLLHLGHGCIITSHSIVRVHWGNYALISTWFELWPLLLTWINFNPSMDNYTHAPVLHHWSLGMDKSFHSTFYNGCNYLSMLRLKLFHVCKGGHWCLSVIEDPGSDSQNLIDLIWITL